MGKGTCPVGFEWEALVAAVGEYEAMRDFMENDETVRPVEKVLEKLAQENRYLQESEVPSPNPPKSLELMGEKEVRNLQNTMEVKMVDERNENLTAKAGQSYVFLNKRDAERFTKVVENEKGYPKEFVVTKKITRYERSEKNPLVMNPYNEYVDVVYRKSNKNKKSNLYDIVFADTGEIIAEKVRVLSVSKDVKSEIAEKYGLVHTPTKVFNANRSIAFALYRQKPSKAKYIAQAKRYLYDAIKFLNPDETSLKINLDEIAQMLDAFPDEMWDYINTTYGMDSSASTRINASISLARNIKFKLPKLGLAQELEKIVGFKLIGKSFKAYDRSGGLQKILRVEWGDMIVIDPSTMSTKQLMVAISYYLKNKNYFKPSSEYTNVAKYAEHNNIDPDKLYKLVFGSMDEAIENIAYNQTGNSDEMEVSKWRDQIKNYDWQAVELFDKPYERFREKAKEHITEKFKDKKLSNGISHLDFFFSGNFNWLNINFNNMSGTYYLPDMETEGYVGVDVRNPFVMDFNKPMAGRHFLKEEEVFNRLAAILHEPFHALHALAYGTKEEKDLRKAFDDLSRTAFGKEMLNQVFGSGYNQGQPMSFDTMYKEFVAFTGQLMLYPKQWIDRTDLRSNDIYDFILKIQGLQDKTYKEIVRTQKKMGTVKKTIMEERTETETVQETEQIKLNFLEKLYNFIVKALNDIIPLSRKFFNVIEESRVISKEVSRNYLEPVEVEEDVFGTEEEEVTKVKPLPAKIKKDKEAFLEAMENFKSSIVTLMQIDAASFASDNMTSFFKKGGYEQEAGSMTSDNMNYYREQTIQDIDNQIIEEQGDLPMQPTQQNQTRGREILTKLMNKLSEALGIPYQLITGEEAKELTKSAKVPWSGEKGFYHDGIAYFVGDNLTTNVVFHEFAHPFVEAIRRSNSKLFNNIYSKLMSSPEGQEIIATVTKLYPELGIDSDMFKEEVITRAIERLADNKFKNQGSSKSLIDAVKDFLYWVKTKLRELFGRNVTVSKLDVNTTLDELADMLTKGKQFNVMSEIVRSSDATRYLKSMEQEINDVSKITNEDLVELATQGFKASILSLESMRNNQNYLEMLEVFKDELGQSNFEEIKKNLSQYRKELDEKTADMIDEMKYTQDHVESLVNTFYRLSRTIRKISNHLATMINDIDNPEIIAKAQSYARTLNFWSSFISFSLETFEKNGLSSENEIYKLVSSISEEIVRGNKHLSVINGEGVKSILMKRLAPFGQAVLERMDSMLKTYRKNDAPQSMIDRVYVQVYGMTEAEFNEYEKMKADGRTMEKRYQMLKEKMMTGAFVSEEKIEMLLSGQLNDVNWANSYLESYMYNDDYVVGGFSLFVKDAIDEVFVRAQAKYNDFATEVMPLLEENGYNPNNIGELGKKLGFIDAILVYDDKTGKYEKKEIYTFLNPWRDYRYQTDLMNQNIKEARERFNMTKTKEDEIALANAINVKTQHDIDFMHQEFVPEYYDRRNTFTDYGKDQLAVQALLLRDEILRTIRNLQQQTHNEKGFMEVAKQIDEKWNEYNLLHSLYDTNGKLKKDIQIAKDPDTGAEMEIVTNDLSIAKKLIEYRDQMSKYQEYVPIVGAFDGALKRYEQELLNQGITGDEFTKARNAWIDRNSRVVIKKEFWEKRRQIMIRIKELLSKLPRPEEKIKQLDEAFKNINDAVIGFRDEDGQPNGTALSPGRLKIVKDSMETIERLKEEIPTTFGLTNAQRKEMEHLENMEAYSFAGLNDEDYKKLVALRELRKKNLKDFTKEMGSELKGLLASLEELQSNIPTEYYLGQLNAIIENIDSDDVKQQLKFTFGPDKLDADAANNLLNIGPADKYRNMLVKLMENTDFKTWFEANHIKKTRRVYNPESETYDQEVYYQRIYTWNVIRPNDPQYYEQHQILDENGKPVGDPIRGLPSRRFYKREVKDEYRTGYDKTTKQVKLIVGVHIDNKNKWLPRENAPNNPYRNQEYYDLKNNNPKLFKLLEVMKRKHLEFQEGLDNASKLYLDFPRFAKSNLELLQTRRDAKVKGNWLRLLLRRIKEFFKGSKEEPESGHNWSDDYKVATLDIFDKDEYSIPIRGLYDIALDDVSTDITNSMLRYMISAEENKRLNEIHPVAVAMRQTLQSNGADNFRRMMKRNLNSGEFTYRNKDMNKIRREVVNNFIERTFYGQVNKGPFHDSKFLQNLSQGMFQMASVGFFAFNIPSALKNQLGAKIQNFIEGAAGMYYTLKDLSKGEIWSNATMGEVSMQIYKKSPKSLNVQLWEIFDPVFSFKQKAKKEGMSRSFLKDLTHPTGIAMNFRKWTEMQGSMQLFAAMLYATKVKMGDKTISLMDAWEVREGKIQLKEGVDPEYGIIYDADGNQKIGKKFLEVKNKIEAVHRKLQGAYDEFNQPEAQRYSAFRFVSFLRRYFTTMFIDRFGFKYKNGQVQPRFNPGLGSMEEGFYVTLLRYLGDIFRHGPKRLVYATPEERRAILKTTMDVAILVLTTLIISQIFGWDPDDDERYQKLREKSGPLRLFPFVAEDEYQFHMGGWLSNHMLNLLMQMRGEQNQFLPLPGMGLDDYQGMITNMGSSAAFGPTLEMGFSMVQDLTRIMTGSDKAWYKREVGPYTWQQDGGSKFMAHLARMAAFTGTTVDPNVGIKNYQAVELGFNR